MPSKVFFVPYQEDREKNIDCLKKLFDSSGAARSFSNNDSVAVKMHFGEPGNTAYLKPHYIRPVVQKIIERGGRPFLTDANTLYKGGRSDTKTHLESAKKHGYSPETMGVPVVIADGPDSRQAKKIRVDLKHFKEVSIAKAAAEADSLIAISHFKGHDCTGYGGAIKNVGMGLGSRAGKQQMHADVKPKVNKELCSGDGICVEYCPASAITLIDQKAVIDMSKCIGCAECVVVCPASAIAISWSGKPDSIQEKMAEYALGAVKDKKDKCFFFNYLIDISPNCDCYDRNDPPIADDIGFLASTDMTAIDQASFDLLQKALRPLYPNIDPGVQTAHAEKIGLGSRKYEIIEI